jgi:hypothetical protein
VRDLEEPTDEFAFRPTAKASDGLQRGEVDLLKEVLSRGLLADAPQELAKDSSIGSVIELGECVPILAASPVEPFDIARGRVFIWQ